ncbi:MAG: YceI family protein [Calditrichia bacterium]|nr:YceI family protein [Calditrichia bacterium]
MQLYRIFVICLILASLGLTGEYQVDKEQENLVKFISDAPMEDFEGVSEKIDGYIFWEGDDLLKKSEMYFEVDLNSLDTGIGLRNRHMRDNYLETDQFPFTHFTGKLTNAEMVKEGEYSVTAEGTMFIHGIEKPMTVDATMQATENGYRIQAKFITVLSDFNVEIPQLMFFKIDENMRLELDYYVKQVVNE